MSNTSKRRHCTRCLRPLRTCMCEWITATANEVELVILQHPLEVNNVKNTARLLHLSLSNSRLIEGESFGDHFLLNSLGRDNKTSLLLYPPTPEETAMNLLTPPPLPRLDNLNSKQLRLIVLDGTWRKSRKMLYVNPYLQQLPRLSLASCPASAYRIRKAHAEDQLSTLEASCYALQQLEDNHVDYSLLLHAFSGFVQQQLALMPPRQ